MANKVCWTESIRELENNNDATLIASSTGTKYQIFKYKNSKHKSAHQ